MLRELAYLILVFSLLTSCYGCLSAAICCYTKQKSLLYSSKIASFYTTILTVFACLLLIYSFCINDYSFLYVYKNSSNDLPFFYRVSAFWSSLEGSHLLWTTLLSLFVTIALGSYHKKNENLIPFLSFSSQAILAWMFFLACTSSNPFVSLFPSLTNGMGMNELLQNPYMMIHPPILFTGYTTLTIPFFYSLSSLWNGELYKECLLTLKRWALFSWIFLTVGIFLGGRWAYVELGWAGYWAWDPVENSSFLPWLFLTAFLHALILVKDTGKYKQILFFLSSLSAFFSYFGTFITRSGIINSVHSFAQSDVATSYLYFLAGLLGFLIMVYALKGQKTLHSNFSWIPRIYQSQFLVLAQMLFASFAFVILMGTLYPIISEYITGIRFNVQAPYFNSFAPYIGFFFILLMTIGNLFRRKKKYNYLKKKDLFIATFASLILSILFYWGGKINLTQSLYGLSMQVIGVFLCFISGSLLAYDLYYQIKETKSPNKLRPIGSFISHVGLLIAVLGFLGNYRGLSQFKTLNKSEEFSFYHHSFQFRGLQITQEDNVLFYKAPVSFKKDGQDLGTIYPARAKYPTKKELIHEVDYYSSFWHDIYITLIDFDLKEGLWATLEFHINPSVRLVWISLLFFFVGGILSLASSFIKQD